MCLFHWHLHDRNRDVGLALLVKGEHRVVVLLVDVVAGQDQQRVGAPVRHRRQVLVHRVGRALVPVAAFATEVRLQHPNAASHAVEVPRPPDANVVVQAVRAVLRQHGDAVDLRVHAVRQREVDNAVLAGKRDRRFGTLSREYTQSLPLAASQDDGGHVTHGHSFEVYRPTG